MAEDLQSKAADLVRKVLTVGVGTIFLTEESLRNLISEFKLPKELLGNVLESASKTKNDFFARLSQDILAQFKDKVKVEDLMQDFFAKNEIDFSVKVRVSPRKKD